MGRIRDYLHDGAEGFDGKLMANVSLSGGGIDVKIEGYGDYSSQNGHGTPVFLELYRGELRLVVFADINSEEPTHIISLEGAREDKRKE